MCRTERQDYRFDNIFVFIEIISYSKLFHVRPVTQTDVYRADAKEIPRIFQVFNSKLMFIVQQTWHIILSKIFP